MASGPVPKRSSERRRRNKDSKPQKVSYQGGKVTRPRARSHWAPIAKSWFTSLSESGQTQFYEPSDWAAAVYVAEIMSRHLKDSRPSAVLFAAVWGAMGDLLTTEGDRRRVRMEIERGEPDDGSAKVTAIDAYRSRLAGKR